jgi:hypothetical protein
MFLLLLPEVEEKIKKKYAVLHKKILFPAAHLYGKCSACTGG